LPAYVTIGGIKTPPFFPPNIGAGSSRRSIWSVDIRAIPSRMNRISTIGIAFDTANYKGGKKWLLGAEVEG
jgi:hypothetical protein